MASHNPKKLTTSIPTRASKKIKPKPWLPIPFHSEDSLESYMQLANQIPMLSAEEEKELAMKLKYQDDLDAAQQLIMSHLRFVVKVAKGFSGYGLPVQDLIQEGNIGLMKAVRRFDPDMGVRLVSFAVHWIKAEMHEYILKNWRIVKIATTKSQRKLFFNLRSQKSRLGWFSKEEISAVAEALDVPESSVVEMEKRMSSYDMAFDISEEEEDNAAHNLYAPSLYLEDHSSTPEAMIDADEKQHLEKEQLHFAIEKLDDRSRDIVLTRWLDDNKLTLHDLADKYGVSAERIRQIEVKALAKMKSFLE